MATIITLEGLPAIVAREENPPAGELATADQPHGRHLGTSQ
ncbi:MAG: hypothetical protein NTW85_10805 [Methylococcales bacterium]|nr:hypothetical protein [Methylococcales bacterium]